MEPFRLGARFGVSLLALVCVSRGITIAEPGLRTGVRVRGDILPVIKKRLVKTSRGSLFLLPRGAGSMCPDLFIL